MRAAEELIDCIVNSSRIPAGKRRREIQRELRCHIEDYVAAAHEAGREQADIEQQVLANFGDPGQIAKGFAWVYRHERQRLQALAYTLSTVILASCLLAAILAGQAGLAFGFGTPILHVLASRHTLIEALDILASVAAYLGIRSLEDLFGSQKFLKAAWFVTMIFTVVMGSCAAAGLHATTFLIYGLVNGIFSRAVQLFVAPKAARFAIVAVCFPLAGLVLTLLRSPASQVAVAAIGASWFIMGVGYQLMTLVATRVDAALLNGLERIQARY